MKRALRSGRLVKVPDPVEPTKESDELKQAQFLESKYLKKTKKERHAKWFPDLVKVVDERQAKLAEQEVEWPDEQREASERAVPAPLLLVRISLPMGYLHLTLATGFSRIIF